MNRYGNVKELEEMKAFLGEHVAVESKDNANIAYRYFVTNNYLLDLQEYLMSKSGDETVLAGHGNILSKVIFLFDDYNQDIEDFLVGLCKKLNLKHYEFYTTLLNKCSNAELNLQALTNELNIINPDLIISMSDTEISIGNCKINYISKLEFNDMLYLLANEASLNEDEKVRLEGYRCTIWGKLKDIIGRYTPLV